MDARGDFWRRPKPVSKVNPLTTRPLTIPVPTWKALNTAERRHIWNKIEQARRQDVATDHPPATAEALPPEEEDKQAKIRLALREPDDDSGAAPAAAPTSLDCSTTPTVLHDSAGYDGGVDCLPGLPGLMRKFDPSYAKTFDAVVLREDDPDSTDTGGF